MNSSNQITDHAKCKSFVSNVSTIVSGVPALYSITEINIPVTDGTVYATNSFTPPTTIDQFAITGGNFTTTSETFSVPGVTETISIEGSKVDTESLLVTVSLTGSSSQTITKEYGPDSSASWSVAIDKNEMATLGEGVINYTVTANDSAGNVSSQGSSSFLIAWIQIQQVQSHLLT